MKKNLLYILLVITGFAIFPGKINSQVLQATSHYGSTSTSIIIALRPNYNFNGVLDEVGFVIQVPKVVNGSPNPLPIITVLNNFLPTTFDTWIQQSESISDPNFYNFKFGKVSLSTAPTIVKASGSELQVLELQISGPQEAIPFTRLAHLASGGPSTQYGVYFRDKAGNDLTNYIQMFYGTGVVPAAPLASEIAGYDAYQYVLPSANPLPVKFLGFNAVKRDNDAVLTWQIENETAITDRYEIERSLSGTDFKKIATIAPKNNGSSRNSYDLTDHDLSSVRSSGVFYYRIKQTDKDGKFIYSDVKSVRLNSKGIVIGVYPNPVKGTAKLTADMEQDAIATISITDASGKQVQTLQVPLFKGANNKDINMTSLAAGSYILKVQTATEVKTIPVVKAN